jgi:hypothetical protein
MLAIETESVELRTYCTPVFPALLQTPAYARAHLSVWMSELSHDDVERYVGLRRARQAALLDPATDLRLDAVIDEGAVRRQVGSPATHAEQVTWLVDLLEGCAAEGRDDVLVRILPFAAGVPARAMSAFVLFTPRDADFDPVQALVEGTDGSNWYDTQDEVAHLEDLFDQVKSLSLTPHASLEFLRRL